MGCSSLNHIPMNSAHKENTTNLYEYSNQEYFYGDPDPFEIFLDDIWKSRQAQDLSNQEVSEEDDYDSSIASKQHFITFLKDGSMKARNYVGIIKYNQHTINLLPKIFYNNTSETPSDLEIQAIQSNILWWLSYCRKIRFPKSLSNLSSIQSNFFEVLIYMFANYTRNVLNNCLYQAYTEVHNEIGFMKGRLSINSYISENLSKGRWHKLSCIYDTFDFDNLFNRIIKSVTSLLFGTTQVVKNKQLLSEILFILDDVTDINATYADCGKIQLNPLYEDMYTVLDYCRLFLSNSISYSYKNQFKVFAFLLPMEYVFEDFLYGFMDKHLRPIPGIRKLKSQKSDLYLAELYENDKPVKDKVFNLKHDIYFEYNKQKIIVDAKYKVAYTSGTYPPTQEYKHGVSQSDLYQMVSYGIRREATEIYLMYPQTHPGQSYTSNETKVKFRIHDKLANKYIDINIVQIPIIHHAFPDNNPKLSLQKNFEENDTLLLNKLVSCFSL